MYQVEDTPIETLHVYVVKEEEPRPAILPIVFSVLLLAGIIAVGTLFPYRQPLEQQTIHVPANFLPPITFTASAPIIPTGIHTYPATQAHGTLTIYNGSILQQEIPAGMIVSAQGKEVVVDSSAIVPPGNPPTYGIATVPAHAVLAGEQGNIPAFAINQVYGASLYIRNLTAFLSGKDAYSIKVVTPQDRQTAINTVRASLTAQFARRHAILAKPCYESSQVKSTVVQLFWTCQYVTYTVSPSMHVTHAIPVGKSFLLDVVFVARPRRIETK